MSVQVCILVAVMAVEQGDIWGSVRAPDGAALENVEVFVLSTRDAPGPLHMLNGLPRGNEFSYGRLGPHRTFTNAAGRFSFPSTSESFVLVIRHATGFAAVDSDEFMKDTEITLEDWGRVEGILRVRGAAAPGELVQTSVSKGNGNTPSIVYQLRAETNRDGRFVFDRVPPGQGSIGRSYVREWAGGRSEGSLYSTSLTVEANKRIEVSLGGWGRPVAGALVASSDAAACCDWTRVHAWFHVWHRAEGAKGIPCDEVTPAAPDRKPLGLAQANREGVPSFFNVELADDGSFRVDDVPPGHYQFRAESRDPSSYQIMYLAERDFEVPETGSNKSERPFDLGVFEMAASPNPE